MLPHLKERLRIIESNIKIKKLKRQEFPIPAKNRKKQMIKAQMNGKENKDTMGQINTVNS